MELFDDFDLEAKGYLRADQLQQAYYEVFDQTVWHGHVDFVMSEHADKGGKLKRKQFETAMAELTRRHELEQALYWDYQSISKYSDRKLTVSEGLLLAQIAHGDYFSGKEWKRFINNRPIKDSPLSWNDLRVFLCTIPTNGGQNESIDFESSRKRIRLDLEQNEIDEAKARGKADGEKKLEYLREEIAFTQARMLNVFEQYGAIAMIFDDGSDPSRQVIKEENFSADWVKVQMSEAEWRRLNEAERQALLLKAKLLEKQLRKEMYGNDWLAEKDRLAGDEAALAELDRQKRMAYDKAMKLRLLNMRNKAEITELGDLGNQTELTEELEVVEEKLTADWVKLEMDEAEWRKLSERERQELIREAKLAQRKLRSEMYGDQWLEELARMNGQVTEEDALRKRKREEFDRRLKAMLFEKHREKESTINTQEQTVVQIEETITIETDTETQTEVFFLADLDLIEDETSEKQNEKLEKLYADWVAEQMHEVDMRAMSEAERQAYLTKVKLAQRKARAELYGEEWKTQLAALEGDVEQQKKLEVEQRELFNKRLKLLLAGKIVKENNQEEALIEEKSLTVKAESVEEVVYFADFDLEEADTTVETSQKLEKLAADWVAVEMAEVNLRNMSEAERQKYLTKVKLAQRKARAELYGEEWKTQLAALEGDVEKQKEFEAKQRDLFNKRLKVLLAGKKITEKTHLIECIIVDDALESKLAEKWHSKHMFGQFLDQDPPIIETVVKESRDLKTQLYIETYGEAYQKEVERLQSNQKSLDEWKSSKSTEFDNRLKKMIVEMFEDILTKIVKVKYEIVEKKYGKSMNDQKAVELELVKEIDKNDVLSPMIDNLFECSLASGIKQVKAINFMVANFEDNRNSEEFGQSLELFLLDIESKEIDMDQINQILNDKRLQEIKNEMDATLTFIKFKRSVQHEINTFMAEDLFTVAGTEYSRYPDFYLNAKLFQFYIRIQHENMIDDPKQSKKLAKECLATVYGRYLQNTSNKGFTIKSTVYLNVYTFLLGYKNQFELVLDLPISLLIVNSCIINDRNLIEQQNVQEVLVQIEEKYSTLRRKALRLLSKGDPTNPRPVAEAKKFFDEMEAAIQDTKRDNKKVAKYMAKYGFQLPTSGHQEPEAFFGANMARLVAWARTNETETISEDDIIPGSTLIPRDLFYSLFHYEELEKAVTILIAQRANDSRIGYTFDRFIRYCHGWHHVEAERLTRIDDFIAAYQSTVLRTRRHFIPDIRIKEDGARYIAVARSILQQKESHPVRGADVKPKTTERSDWRLLYFRNHHVLEQHAIDLMRLLLMEEEGVELKNYAMSVDAEKRMVRVNEIKEQLKKVDLTNPIGQTDNQSWLREVTAYEYAARYHRMLRFSADDDIQETDIYASIMADLLEHIDRVFESEWFKDPEDYFDESIEIQNKVKSEKESKTSKFVWDVLLQSTTNRIEQELKEQVESAKTENENKRLSEALLKTLGSQRYSQLSERDRQAKIMELRRLDRQSRKSNHAQKVLADFNGDEAKYEEYRKQEKERQKAEIEAKIARLKKESTTSNEAQIIDEVEALETLKRSLSDLSKDQRGQSDEDLMKQLKLVNDETMSEEKRQRMLIQMKIARQRAKIDGIEDINVWIMNTDQSSLTNQEKEKARQMAIAKARLEAAHRRRAEGKSVEVSTTNTTFEDQISNTFAQFNNEEIDMVAKVAESKEFEKFKTIEKQELITKIQKTEDIEEAISLRLAYIAQTQIGEEPVVILVNQVTEQQAILQEQILKSYRGNEIIEQITKQKHEATRSVVYAVNSDERIEQELKEKYNQIKQIQAEEAIIEEITKSVWDRQSDEDQKILIDEVCQFENVDDGVKQNAKITELAKSSDKTEQITAEEKRESKRKRQNILENLDKNYDRELNSILGRIGNLDSKQQSEKARQLAMMKLRRERQNLKHENLGYEANKFTREITMIQDKSRTEKDRQRQLAQERHRQRMAARAKQSEVEREENVKEMIDNIFDEDKLRDNIVDAEVNSEMTLIEQIMNNLDLLHQKELSVLESLFFTVIDNETTFKQAEQMDQADLDKRLARYQSKRIKYFNSCIAEEMPDHLIVQNLTTQMELMAKVTMLKIVQMMKSKDISHDETTIELTSTLKSLQKFVIDNVELILETENDDDTLTELVKVLIRARNEFWSPNSTTVLLYEIPNIAEQGKQIGQQWLHLARKQLRREIGQDLMAKKLADLREESRQKQGVNANQLGQYDRMKTVIDPNITKADEDALVAKLKRDLANEERRSRMARNTYRDKLQKQLLKARESKLAAEEKQVEDLTAIMRDHTIFIERDADRRAKQKLQLTEVITRKKREKTIIMEQKKQGKTFLERHENEDMDNLAAKLQAEAEDQQRESKVREGLPRENTDDALKSAEMTSEVIEDVTTLQMQREKTMARKRSKKVKRKSEAANSEPVTTESPAEPKNV